MKPKTFKTIPLTFNRRAVIASASVTRGKNTIHCITEVDITMPRLLIREHFTRTGEKLSLTAYVVTCLAHTIKDHPLLNSFISGRKQVIMDNVTVSVLIERELTGEKVPEPLAIEKAQLKNYKEINDEIRRAQNSSVNDLGGLSGMVWIKMIPGFLLKTFVRIADRNIKMAEKYGKVAVTAVGMFSRESAWFIPHGSATVLITVGGINQKQEFKEGKITETEYLCLTASFDHNIVDGAPASRFMKQFTEIVRSGDLIKLT